MKRLLVSLGLSLTATTAFSLGFAFNAIWTRNDVIPVVLVKPGIGGFVPVEGSSIGNHWSKNEVKAVMLVRPSIGGFAPVEGIAIGNSWAKEDVIPVALVAPSVGGFTSVEMSKKAPEQPTIPNLRRPNEDRSPATPSLIETRIDGDFQGWEGETIVKLINGQIWQQSEYYYHYHYAYSPEVLIFRAGAGYKMKIDGVPKAISVIRLK